MHGTPGYAPPPRSAGRRATQEGCPRALSYPPPRAACCSTRPRASRACTRRFPIRAAAEGETDAVALQATLACLLWETFVQANWCGFYRRVGRVDARGRALPGHHGLPAHRLRARRVRRVRAHAAGAAGARRARVPRSHRVRRSHPGRARGPGGVARRCCAPCSISTRPCRAASARPRPTRWRPWWATCSVAATSSGDGAAHGRRKLARCRTTTISSSSVWALRARRPPRRPPTSASASRASSALASRAEPPSTPAPCPARPCARRRSSCRAFASASSTA